METENYLQDISEIKNMMDKSSRFISLSGLSGIMAGIYSLIGAAFAYYVVTTGELGYLILDGYIYQLVILDLGVIAILSLATGIFLSHKKAKKRGEKIWNSTSKKLLLSLATPLLTGGIYILIILEQQKYGQTAGLMLIFYGLSLVNGSKYTLGDIRYLGYLEIALGLICAFLPGYGFWLWVLGFGILHIIYGALMYFKYDRN